jgi:signal transduction histidine kinase
LVIGRINLQAIAHALGALREPRTLRLCIISSYAFTGAFALFLTFAVQGGLMRWHPAFPALLGAKLTTTSLTLIAARLRRAVVPLAALNIAMDAVGMTGALWVTGGTASPLVSIYVVEIAVLALLTNLTTTVLTGALCLVLYMAMGALTMAGALPEFPTPAQAAGVDSWSFFAVASAFTAFVIAAPAFYTSRILRRLKDNEHRLEAKTAALVDAGRQKAQFMANITHELRSPLHGIMGLGELVASGVYGEPSDRQRQAMSHMKGSAQRLLTLIDDLLLLASSDAGKLGLKLERVDLAELLPGTIATAQWLIRSGKQLTLALDLAPDLAPITSDRGKLNQIVLNLVSNAIKFTPDGGSITVRVRHTPDRDGVTIEVADTGIGIPSDHLGRIFDEFYQVDGSLTREHGGVGLGLALVRRLLAMLGGSVEVTSELGRGSTFRVRLPLAGPPPAATQSSGP